MRPKRDVIDVRYEVIEGPRRRVELPGWFKAIVWLTLIALFAVALPLHRWHEAHKPAAGEAGAAGSLAADGR